MPNQLLKSNSILIALIIFVLLAVAAFFVFREQLPQANRFTINIEDCTVTTEANISVEEGNELTLLVTSDQDAEFHIHGYNLKRGLVAGEEQKITFTASDPGRYDYELENECALGVLTVTDGEGNVPESVSEEHHHGNDEATESAEEDHKEDHHE